MLVEMSPPNSAEFHMEPSSYRYPTLAAAALAFKHDRTTYQDIYSAFTDAVIITPKLLGHRRLIEERGLGFGDRAFHWMWKLLVDAMPQHFSFLEIGVYKGQVISLVGLLAMVAGKNARVTGVTPLAPVTDKVSSYEAVDYGKIIEERQAWCGLPPGRRAHLIEGLSTQDNVKRRTRANAPYNVVYIDGGHDYEIVANDIIAYGEMVAPGGYLVMDDASVSLEMPEGIWRGHADVGRAVRELIEPNPYLHDLLAVGHLRVWRKSADAP